MNLAVLGVAFFLIFLAEMGDKTQLLAVSLASRYDHKKVFFAVTLALMVVTLIGVAFGTVIFSFIPIFWVRFAAALLFLTFGVWTLLSHEKEEDEDSVGEDEKIFHKAFSLTFMAEMGDKTQLAAIALTASTTAPLEVFTGATIGFLAVTAIGVWIGRKLGEKLDPKLLERAGGILFLIIGAFMLVELLF